MYVKVAFKKCARAFVRDSCFYVISDYTESDCLPVLQARNIAICVEFRNSDEEHAKALRVRLPLSAAVPFAVLAQNVVGFLSCFVLFFFFP